MTALPRSSWDHERRARELMPRREELLRRLPQRFPPARRFSQDVREQIVDEAITVAAVRYEKAIHNADELARVFWDAVKKRVVRVQTGRYATVRAGFTRADLAALETVGDHDTPERVALERAETHVALQFAALLQGDARPVFACHWQWTGKKELGARRIAKDTGLSLDRVRAAELAIETETKRFTAILTAGRLCGFLGPAIAALAAGEHVHRLEDAARVHLNVYRCPTCRADYTRQLRYLRSARFRGKVAQLL